MKLEDLPVYSYIDDLVLVGTNHLLDFRKDKDKTKHFAGELKEMEHLILEGYKSQYTSNEGYPNYECLAHSIGNKLLDSENIRFIEEGEDFIEANGIRKDLFGFYMVCGNLKFMGNKNSNEKEFYDSLMHLTKVLDEVYPAINQQETINQLIQVFPYYGDVNSLYTLARAWTNHSSRNRDHYIFGPKSLKWKEELKGKKVELVGSNHFLFLQKYLRGEEIKPLGHWHDTLDEKHRKIAEDIEEVIFPEFFSYG